MKFRICLELNDAYATYQNCWNSYSGTWMENCRLQFKKKKSLKMNDLSIQIEIVVVVIVVLGMGGWNLEEESTAR